MQYGNILKYIVTKLRHWYHKMCYIKLFWDKIDSTIYHLCIIYKLSNSNIKKKIELYIYFPRQIIKYLIFIVFIISLYGYYLWVIKCRAWNWFKVFSCCVIFCEFSKTAFHSNNELVSCIYLSQRYTDVNKLLIFGMIHYTVELAKWSMSAICLVHKQVITAVKIF